MKSKFFGMKSGSATTYVLICIGVALLFGCAGGRGRLASGGEDSALIKNDGGNAGNGEFPYLEVPVYITNQLDALCYNIERFWNPYFYKAAKDTALYSMDEEKFEQAYVRYITLLQVLEREKLVFQGEDAQKAAKVIDNSHKLIFAEADSLYALGFKKPLMRLIDMSERYLYNPNSPFLNEELYIPVVDAVLELKSLDSLQKMQHIYQKKMVMLNRKGTQAADFDYEYLLPDRKSSLSSDVPERGVRRGYSSLYKTEAEYLLIYFNTPGCASCKEIKAVLTSNPTIGYMLEEGRLKVLSMFIDKDVKTWEERFADSPPNWIYARDYQNQFETNELYGIRAIPSMYLLDSNKKVILKDAPVERVIEYFNNNRQTISI